MVVRGAASAAQDGRFSRKSKKDMSNFKIPSEYNLKVDFSKLVWPPLEAWVMKRVTELLKGAEDEVLVGTILESLKVKTKAKELHYELVPFLCNNTTLFVKELWTMLHSASNNATGIPDQLQQEEIQRLKERQEQAAALQEKLRLARERQAVPRGPGGAPRRARSRSGSPRRDGPRNDSPRAFRRDASPRGHRREDAYGGGNGAPPRHPGPGRRGDDRGDLHYGGDSRGCRGDRGYRDDRDFRGPRDFRDQRRRDDGGFDSAPQRSRGYDVRDARPRRDAPGMAAGDMRNGRPYRGDGVQQGPRDQMQASDVRRRSRRDDGGAEARYDGRDELRDNRRAERRDDRRGDGRDDRRDDRRDVRRDVRRDDAHRRRGEAEGGPAMNGADRRHTRLDSDGRASPAQRGQSGRDERAGRTSCGDDQAGSIEEGGDGNASGDDGREAAVGQEGGAKRRRRQSADGGDGCEDEAEVGRRKSGDGGHHRECTPDEEDQGLHRERDGERNGEDVVEEEEEGRRRSRHEREERAGYGGERKERKERRHKGEKKHKSDKEKKSKKSHKHKSQKRSRHVSPGEEAPAGPARTPEPDHGSDGHTPPPKRSRHDSASPAAEDRPQELAHGSPEGRREPESPSRRPARSEDADPSPLGHRRHSRSGSPSPRHLVSEADGAHDAGAGHARSPRHGDTGRVGRKSSPRDSPQGDVSRDSLRRPPEAGVDLEELRAEARRAQKQARSSDGDGRGSGSPRG